MSKRTRIILLGATGSIGDSALKLIRNAPERFEIVAMTAHSNAQKLAQLAHEFKPKALGLTVVDTTLPSPFAYDTPLHTGEDAACDVLDYEADIVIAAMMGAAGVLPVMKAATLGRTIALANKEALVCAGSLIMQACHTYKATLLPIDSEHNAIFQLLSDKAHSSLSHITLTASGGPFLNMPMASLVAVTPEQAIAHPKWSMGAKISVDSATMMNKGLECIEAHWLFGLEAGRMKVMIHPQAIIHGMATFDDGSTLAYASPADMMIPISYCLYAPQRATLPDQILTLDMLNGLTFFNVENERFPALKICLDALQEGNASTIALNASNEVAVGAFLQKRIGFCNITSLVEEITAKHTGHNPKTIEDVLQLDADIRIKTEETITKAYKIYA